MNRGAADRSETETRQQRAVFEGRRKKQTHKQTHKQTKEGPRTASEWLSIP